MRCYDEQLRRLQTQCARKKKSEASVEELRVQRNAYATRAEELQKIMSDEQADVERLMEFVFRKCSCGFRIQ